MLEMSRKAIVCKSCFFLHLKLCIFEIIAISSQHCFWALIIDYKCLIKCFYCLFSVHLYGLHFAEILFLARMVLTARDCHRFTVTKAGTSDHS